MPSIHMNLFRRKSRTVEDDSPASYPPTYIQATADQERRLVPVGKGKYDQSPSTMLVVPEANPELIDPAFDEAAAEQQLLDAATAFIPPPPGPPPSHPDYYRQAAAAGSQTGENPLGRINLETQPLPGASRAGYPPLRNPILIPRVNPGSTMPFTRAFAPSLESSHGIDEATFLAFVDHLNVISAPHAATTLLDFSSTIMGFMPLDYADGIAVALQLAAMASQHLIAHKRCKAYLARVNTAYFEPRGLHARIVGTKEVRRVLGVGKEDPLVAPLGRDTIDLTCQQRCLAGLEARGAAPLVTEGLAVPGKETAVLARLAAWQVRQKLAESEKSAKRARKRAIKKMEKGKKVKKEGSGERYRLKMLGWLLIEDVAEYEAYVEEKERAKREKN